MTEQSKQAKPTLTPVKLLYATWDGDGKRHERGAIVDVPVPMAKEMIATGKAERADPFPGE